MKPRKPIRRVSPLRAKQNAEYGKLKRIFMKLNPVCCVAGCSAKSRDLHHSRGRSNRLLTYTPAWKALCRPCHERVRTDLNWARKNELLCAPGQWNIYPK